MQEFERMMPTLKKAAAALRDAEVPFLLAGGLACWARGGPETDHDLDFMVREEDAERALETLVEAGMRPERPPEAWLYKAWDGDVLVDLIFRPASGPVDERMFARGSLLEVDAVEMHVLSLEDVLVTKLLALGEHSVDYDSVLEVARSLREQIDWADVHGRTAHSPYAAAFFTLVEGLGIVGTRSGR
ncbi:MAG TPA: nucleotidyltransferase family protein [Gaiellaceae bacterium]|nr:nucleotidyltransferase family protein [Gaiellaceae bacterium]